MSTNSSEDLNNQVLIGECSSVLRQVNIEADHLYRHLTEVNGKDTRGGYIEGQLEFQDVLLQKSFALKISLVSAGERRLAGVGCCKRVHPNLLYMTRFEGAKRRRELESRAPLWRIDLEISDGQVFWWTESESQPLYKQEICRLVTGEGGEASVLNLKDLHLTVITPLVRTNVNGIKIRDGLAMRKPMYEDEFFDDCEWEEVVRKLDKFYTGKEGKAEMDRICLQFDFHNITDGNEELMPMCSLISHPIINSRSRNLGILDLLPDVISAQKACCQYSRTIFLPSKFRLPSSEKEAYPRFVVQFHNDNFILDERVKQPSDVKIFAYQIFIFKTPVQDEDAIREIYLSGGKIFLEAYRPKDRQSSDVKLEFEFKVHSNWRNSSIEWCSFCLENPDKVGPSMEESLKLRLQTAGVTKPGTKRRRRDNEGRLISSPEEAASHSPDMTDGRGELYEEIQEYVDDLGNVDIDDLVRHDIPDVLLGVMETGGDSPSPDHQSLARCLSPSPTSAPGAAPRMRSLDSFDSADNEDKPQILFDYDKLSDKLDESSRHSAGLYKGGSQVEQLTSRLRRAGGSHASDSSADSDCKVLPSKSLISRLNKINKTSSQPPGLSSEALENESDQKVSELTKKFGGAKKACMDKIKHKISKQDPDKSLEAMRERGERGDCFPALVFMFTPFVVIVLAVVLNFLWGIYSGVSEMINH